MTSIIDKTGNGYDLTSAAGAFDFGNITPWSFRTFDNKTRNVHRSTNTSYLLPPGNSSLFHGDHEFHCVCSGRLYRNRYLYGTYNFSTASKNYALGINMDGKVFILLSTYFYLTDNPIYEGNGSPKRRMRNRTVFRVVIDFTNDAVKLFINGGLVPVSGSGIASLSPTYYDQSEAFGVGSGNNNNASVGDTDAPTFFNDMFYASVTRHLTNEEYAIILPMLLRK